MLIVRLFGHVRFEFEGTKWPLRVPLKGIELLAYLAAHRAVPISRTFLAELMWPDDDPETGRTNLRRHLHVLARGLPPAASAPYVLATMQTVRWNPDAPALIDTIAFSEAGAAGKVADAIDWYTGEFLEGFHADWIVIERERLRALQLDYFRASLQRKRSERDLAGALGDVARMLAIDPWREDAIRTEMQLRAQLGDRSGALGAYRAFAERLRAELDTEPAPETRAAHEALARSADAVVPLPDAVERPAASATVPPALPFVGRGAELGVLERAWAAAARGRGSMVLVGGEAGTGKSRLAAELALHAESQGGGVLVGTTTPGEARPYEALLDALRDALALVVSSQTPDRLAVLARVLPELAARGGVAEFEAEAARPEVERARIFDALFEAIVALARRRPVLVILEDLHWASASSAALIEHLARRIANLPVLFIGTYREEQAGRAHPLRGLRRRLEAENTLTHVALRRFELADVVEVARRVATPGSDLETLAAEFYAYSEGVPLFLDEAVHARDRAGGGRRLNIPERVERLSEAARVVLEIAAVAGSGFNVEVLREVAGWSEAETLLALDELVEGRFVRESRRRNFGDYGFAHHLVHAAVYEDIPDVQRRRRHARVARVISALYGERPDYAASIALHYERADDSANAARSYAAAARYARSLYANEEAITCAERALALASAAASPSGDLIVDMHVVRGWAGNALGRSTTRSGALEALAALAISPQQQPEVERLRATHAMLEGRFDAARTAARRFVAAAEVLGDGSLVAQAHVECATVAIACDSYEEAGDALRRASACVQPGDDIVPLRILRAETFMAQRRGAHDRELGAAAERLLAEARRLGDPQAEADAHVRLAHVHLASLRFAEARARLDDATEAYRRFGSPRGVDHVKTVAANLALSAADFARAKALYRECYAFAEENNDEANLFNCALGLAFSGLFAGDAAGAASDLGQVAHLYRGSGRYEEANWHLARALVAFELGRRDEAGREFDACLTIHRTKPPTPLHSLSLALASVSAIEAGDRVRAEALVDELTGLPDELQDGEEFPHLSRWVRARVADLRGDRDEAARLVAEAWERFRARVELLGDGAAAYGNVPWNCLFVKAVSLQKPPRLEKT